jgi:hypothetical protein
MSRGLRTLESARIQDAAYLNAQLDVAFAMLTLAKVTRDNQAVRQTVQKARQYYEAATDLLFRSTLVNPQRQQVRDRLDELREELASAGTLMKLADPGPCSP